MEHIYWWQAWRTRGWTLDDLRFLIRYLSMKIRKCERNSGCLKFSNFIKDIDHFEEDLAMARAETRNAPVRSARIEILEATGRTVTTTVNAKPAGDVSNTVLATKAFADFQQWRKQTGL
jgi:hypothetical protein